MTLCVVDQQYFDQVCRFAEQKGMSENLWQKLWYLHRYHDAAGLTRPEPRSAVQMVLGQTRCRLLRDWAPASFAFEMELRRPEGASLPATWQPWFNGGLIFHGDQTGWLDESGEVLKSAVPTFSVTLNRTDGWAVHT